MPAFAASRLPRGVELPDVVRLGHRRARRPGDRVRLHRPDGRPVDVLPTYGGTEVTYLEFAASGSRSACSSSSGSTASPTAVRGEQLMGTLESVLMTPTAPTTVQLGSVAFDLVYIPLRTAIFLGSLALAFGLHFDPSGVVPAIAHPLCVSCPSCGGSASPARRLIMTFRRGAGLVGHRGRWPRAFLRRLLPGRPAPGLGRRRSADEPDRGRDRGDARRAARRPGSSTWRRDRGSFPFAAASLALGIVAFRARAPARAPPRLTGALLMEAIWKRRRRVDRAGRAPVRPPLAPPTPDRRGATAETGVAGAERVRPRRAIEHGDDPRSARAPSVACERRSTARSSC